MEEEAASESYRSEEATPIRLRIDERHFTGCLEPSVSLPRSALKMASPRQFIRAKSN